MLDFSLYHLTKAYVISSRDLTFVPNDTSIDPANMLNFLLVPWDSTYVEHHLLQTQTFLYYVLLI